MKVAYGKSIGLSERIVSGRIRFISSRDYAASVRPAESCEEETARFEAARQKAVARESCLYSEASLKAAGDTAAIFEAHLMILNDESLQQQIRRQISRGKLNAANAVMRVFRRLANQWKQEEGGLEERVADLRDVANLLLDELEEAGGSRESADYRDGGTAGDDARPDKASVPAAGTAEKVILAARDLTPSQVLSLDKERTAGVLLREGSAVSHAAILLRSMDIPALIRCEAVSASWDNETAILDTAQQAVFLDPGADFLEKMKKRAGDVRRKQAALEEYKDLPSVTKSGRRIRICANIENTDGVDAAILNGAEGIGLMRTEFLFLGRSTPPDEEEQYAAYRKVIEAMAPKRVVIRTMDIGAEKTPSYLRMDQETNPALGLRGIRLCFAKPALFKTQLRAILRAGAGTESAAVMFPMVIAASEVRKCREIIRQCADELESEHKAYGIPEIGVMIETPAAALTAEELAEEVDFFSIGTNDLLQYTCALDRGNTRLENYVSRAHPALKRLIGMTVDAAQKKGRAVSVCGEIGADLSKTGILLDMGIDEISVHPAAILPLRQTVRSLS